MRAASDRARRSLNDELAEAPDDVARIEAIRRYAADHGAILGTSHRFAPAGSFWADLVAPGYGTIATGPTRLDAAMAAITQLDHDRAD